MVSTVGDVWGSPDVEQWQFALQRYDATIACQKPVALAALDHWYQHVLPSDIAERPVAHITPDELVRITEWKMARGIWRVPNVVLVRGNAPTGALLYAGQLLH